VKVTLEDGLRALREASEQARSIRANCSSQPIAKRSSSCSNAPI